MADESSPENLYVDFGKMNPFEKAVVLSGKLIRAPGIYGPTHASMALHYGRQIRDDVVHGLPLLPMAIDIYVDIASTREWVVSGNPRIVPRVVEDLNNARCVTNEGYIEYGLEQILKRQARDYICVGRIIDVWEEGDDLEYLDPCYTDYDISKNVWRHIETNREFQVQDISLHHPKPIGGTGAFLSPIFSAIPIASLAYLIQDHDAASIDGRRIRDIALVAGKDLAKLIQTAVADMIKLYTSPDPTKLQIPIVYTEDDVTDVTKLVTYLGVSKLPENFDREDFQFQFVNTVAGATGLPLRRIWNSEKATNRALEQVQEQRQQTTGPAVFVRSRQRMFNNKNCLPKIYKTRRIRFGFVEEVDTETRSVNAEVIKKYAESLEKLAAVFGGVVNGEAFLSWLKSEGILPEDLDLITDLGTMQRSDANITPDKDNIQQESDPKPSPMLKGMNMNQFMEHGEITMNSRGDVLDRRNRVFTMEKAFEEVLLQDEDYVKSIKQPEPIDYHDALKESQANNLQEFLGIIETEKALYGYEKEIAEEISSHLDKLTPSHHRQIFMFLDKRKGVVEDV